MTYWTIYLWTGLALAGLYFLNQLRLDVSYGPTWRYGYRSLAKGTYGVMLAIALPVINLFVVGGWAAMKLIQWGLRVRYRLKELGLA